ncbi:MAG: carboxypeptidase regulatory-like domain-containing protein [Gemmatimonadaceae bacterium]
MRIRTCLALAALATALPGSRLDAQSVIGTVLLPDSLTPVAGAVVIATAPSGAVTGRALTNARGQFALKVGEPGSTKLTVLRIGFRPSAGPTLTLALASTERVRIVVNSATVSLAGMGVRERESCRVSADTGFAVARVWEEARKAMLTSQLSSELVPLYAEWIEYDRALDSLARSVREQHIRTTRSLTTHAFRSVPADVLRDRGFVVEEEGNSVFYAPDAEALLSDTFVSGHCFRLVDPPSGAGALIGVAFVPNGDRRAMREIEGTLWLDRATAELRTLDFRYLNLPEEAAPAHPGGIVDFQRLPDGNWLIARWNVRMPRLTASARIEHRLDRTIAQRRVLTLRGVQVMGGEVTRALRGDSTVFTGKGAAIALQVVSPDTMNVVSTATLTLDGTDYAASANAQGRIRLSPVLAGHYRARVTTASMSALGIPPLERDVEARADAPVDTVTLLSAREVLGNACPRDSIRGDEGMLHGRVFDGTARPTPGALVSITWQDNFSIIATSGGATLSANGHALHAESDAAGRFKVCGVPRGALLIASVAAGDLVDRREVRLGGEPYAAVDLVLHQPVAQSREVEALNAPRAKTLVEIVVTDDHGNALPQATLDIFPASGPSRTIASGRTGIALVPDVARGLMRVRVRKVGLVPGEVTVNVDSARLTLPIVMGAVQAPMLDTVRVVGARVLPARLDEFERRRARHQATVSLTREDIEKRNPVDAWQVLNGVSSLNIGVRDYKVVATSRRQLVDGLSDKPCFTRVMVDGVLLPADGAGFDLRQLPPVADIHGIEYFDGPSSIPMQYAGTAQGLRCGLIAVWTR